MAKTIEDLFYSIAFYSDIIILLLFLIFFKETRTSKGLWLIVIYCLYDILTNKALDYFSENNFLKAYSIAYHSFTFIEYSIFSIFISLQIKNKLFRNIIAWSIPAFGLFLLLYHKVLVLHTKGVDSVPIGIETILILLYAFYYLYEQMNDLSGALIYDKYSFWVITGIMIYLAGSLFIYTFANYDRTVMHQYWFLTNVFYIIKNILFAISIILFVKQLRNPRPKEYYPYIN